MKFKQGKTARKCNPKIIRMARFTSRGSSGYNRIRRYAFGKPLRVPLVRYRWWKVTNHVNTMVNDIKKKRTEASNTAHRKRGIAYKVAYRLLYARQKMIIHEMERILSSNATWRSAIQRACSRVSIKKQLAEKEAVRDKYICGHCGACRNREYVINECSKCRNGFMATGYGGGIVGGSCGSYIDRSCPGCKNSGPSDARFWYTKASPHIMPGGRQEFYAVGRITGMPHMAKRMSSVEGRA